MAVLTNQNKEKFYQIAEVLYDHTKNGTITWEENTSHLFYNESNRYLIAYLSNQKFEVHLKLKDNNLDFTSLIMYDDNLSGDFLLETGYKDNVINQMGELIYNELKSNGKIGNNDGDTLDKILGKVGKEYIREKRLGKLLDDDPTNEEETSFLKRILNRRKKNNL